jgi:hypothetical protein
MTLLELLQQKRKEIYESDLGKLCFSEAEERDIKSRIDVELPALMFNIIAVDFKTACSQAWNAMTDEERASVKTIPNFDAEVFREITGIVVE